MDNQQLSTLKGESSTTIPVMGSREEILNNIPEKEQFILSNWRVIPPVSGIYCILNCINNKAYIGISGNLRKRLKEHYGISKGQKVKGGSKLKNAILKYDIKDFKVYILEYTNKDILKKESKYIDIFNSVKNGYNIIYYDSTYKQTYKKSKEQLEKEKNIKYNNKVSIKETLCYSLTGEFYKKFRSRSEAAEYFNYTRRTLNESVENNTKVILNNSESFYRCKNYIFIDSIVYDGRKVTYLPFKERSIIKNNIPKFAIEISKKPIKFIDLIKNDELLFNSIVEGLTALSIPMSTYYKHKNDNDYLYNNKYILNNKQDIV